MAVNYRTTEVCLRYIFTKFNKKKNHQNPPISEKVTGWLILKNTLYIVTLCHKQLSKRKLFHI